MKTKINLFFLLSVMGFSQVNNPITATLTGPTTAHPGETLHLSLTLFKAAPGLTDSSAAAIQFGLGSGLAPTGDIVLTASPAQANKTLTCADNFSGCILWGLNAATLPNAPAPVVNFNLVLAPTIPPSAINLPLSQLLAVGADGLNDAIISGPVYTLTIIPVIVPQDINADGKVDVVDVNLMIKQYTDSRTTPSSCKNDLNGDGKCDLLDVAQVLFKALGIL